MFLLLLYINPMQGFYVEVMGQAITCVDMSKYGTLLIVDPEEEFFLKEYIFTSSYHAVLYN